jgi:pimeloyl-ACP methyl ester carboxylesterase
MPEWIDIGPCEALSIEGDSDATAIFMPGSRGAGAQALLAYTRLGLQELGWSSLLVWDEYQDDGRHVEWVRERLDAALTATPGPDVVLIAKSLSSFAAGVTAARGIRAVWYTPLLTEDLVVVDLRRATAPFLLVGGTADPMWDASVARAVPGEFVEVEGADHSLHQPHDLLGSVAVLQDVVARAAAFIGSPPR